MEAREGAGTARTDPTEILRRLRASVRRAGPEEGAGGRAERYAVIEEIARGGMGVILRVRDEEMRRTLAMKVLRPADGKGRDHDSSLESQRTARFLEEAQVTGQLDHPGIVPVHELGLDGDGRLFFTMRLVRGRTLGDVFDAVRTGADGWTLTRALGVIQKVCEAMAYAHERSVIHRDLKPSNVMVGRFGETYVMDWGLAKILGEKDTKDVRPAELTQTILSSARKDESGRADDSPLTTMDGDVIGTPAYMPPEQARGMLDAIGPRSDVYSVGALLYHLLAGRAPYLDPEGQVPVLVVLQRLLDGPPAPLARLAPEVSPELVAICEKAMARAPEERYASMLAMADDIQAYIEGRVVAAHETGAVAEFRKWVGRNRGMAASIAAAIVLGFGGLAAVSFVQTRARKDLAEKNEELERTNSALGAARETAEENATLAAANEADARWQSYVANVVAASASINLGAAGDALQRLDACDPGHRGWEWSFLRNQVDASLFSVEASPESFVYAVAYGPNGRRVASGTGNLGGIGGADFAVRLFDAETGAEVRVLEGHEARVTDLAFSPAGTELASAGDDMEVRVWDVASGEVVASRSDLGNSLAYDSDGLRLALGSSNTGSLLLWNLLDDRVSTWLDRSAGIGSVAISQDGSLLAAGFRDYGVKVWDLASRRLLRESRLGSGSAPATLDARWVGVTDVTFAPDGAVLAALADGGLGVIDVETGEVTTIRAHEQPASGIVASPDGRRVVSSGLDATIRFFDRTTGDLLEVLQGHDGPVLALARSPSGDRLISGSQDRSLRFWDGQPGSSVTALQGAASTNIAGFGLAFTPDGSRVAWYRDSKSLCVTDARSGEELFVLPTLSVALSGCAFDAAGERLYTVSSLDHLRTWDAATGELLEISPEPLPCRGIAVFSPDATRFCGYFLEGEEMHLGVWSTRTAELERDWVLADFFASMPSFVPDGRRILCCGAGEILVFDLQEDEPVASLPLPAVFEAVMSPDGSSVAAIGFDTWDDTVHLFDLASGARTAELRGHAQPSRIAYSPDGSRIVTGNWDQTVSLWDPEHGEVVSLRGHRGAIAAVAFDPRGRRIASADLGGHHRIWETTTVGERAQVRREAARRAALADRARPLVDELFERLILPADVVAELAADSSLSEEVRDAAVTIARCRRFEAVPSESDPRSSPVARAYGILLSAERTPDQYLRALRVAEYAVKLVPNAERTPLWTILGLAEYRMGRVERALEHLEASWKVQQEMQEPMLVSLSSAPAVIAMCLVREGRLDEARATLRGRRALAGTFPDSSFQNPANRMMRDATLTLIDEAEALLAREEGQ